MDLFPVLEESIEFNGSPEEAQARLLDLVQLQKPWIVWKYNHPFYGFVSTSNSNFRISRSHAGYYRIHAVFTPNKNRTAIRLHAYVPKWRQATFIVILGILLLSSITISFLVPTGKDLHFALYPLLFSWMVWSRKRDDFKQCMSLMPSLLGTFTQIPHLCAPQPLVQPGPNRH